MIDPSAGVYAITALGIMTMVAAAYFAVFWFIVYSIFWGLTYFYKVVFDFLTYGRD